jgi:hypothetical protein
MYGSKNLNKRNYRSLIIAGVGTIGRSLVTLGNDQFSLFENVHAIDRDPSCLTELQCPGIVFHTGDIAEPQFLKTLLTAVPGPSLFVNLCSGTNNVRIRKNLTVYDTAYLDSCASITEDPEECRFSRLMPYTYADMDCRYPHWLCWGINPGLVEIMARRILADLPDNYRTYDVAVYEFHRLENVKKLGRAAVGWCPEALVEEIMLSPTMLIENGLTKEDLNAGSRECLINWENLPIPARIVAHEDIWNLGEIPTVKNSGFYYSLSPAVMDILKMADAEKARSMLAIPAAGAAITGLEQVAVQITSKNILEDRTLVWTEDHGATWKYHGVNAVQYQTAKSLLLAIMLLQRTDYGLVPHSFNASNLPIAAGDWPVFDRFMKELDIKWDDGSHLNLHVLGNKRKSFISGIGT